MFLDFNEKPHFVWMSASYAVLVPLVPRDRKSLRERDHNHANYGREMWIETELRACVSLVYFAGQLKSYNSRQS